MKPLRPRTLADALAARAAHPEAVPVAGGTDLMVAVNFGRAHPELLLDLSLLDELKGWRRENGSLVIGAAATFAELADGAEICRPLREAARSVGSPQIRNRATIGGNVATASPAGDSIPVLAACGGQVLLAAHDRERRVPWREFFVGPKATSLAADELVVGVELPVVDGPGSFAKVGTRNAMVISIAGLCLQLDARARTVALALGSVAPTVVRAPEAESFAAGIVDWDDPGRPVEQSAAIEFGRLAASAARPIDDVRGSAAYRRHAVDVLARRMLSWALADREAGPW